MLFRIAPSNHPEVLLWHQLEQLQQHVLQPSASSYGQKLQQALDVAGTTHARLQLGPLPLLEPTLQLLPGDMRVLLLHYSPERDELYLAAVNVPDELNPEAVAVAASEAAKSKPPSNTKAGSAGALPGGSVKRVTLLGSVRVTKGKLQELCAGFRDYRRWLGKQLLEVSSTPMSPTASAAGVAAAAAARAAAAGSGAGSAAGCPAGKKGAGVKSSGGGAAAAVAGGGGGKTGGGKEGKGVVSGGPGGVEIPPWLPAGPVFGNEVNEQWRTLLAEVRVVNKTMTHHVHYFHVGPYGFLLFKRVDIQGCAIRVE